jgi:hypothetical protein
MTVPADTQKISLQLDADDRLAAAVGGVARYFADAAGLENAAVLEWQAAVIAACKREFAEFSGGNARLEATLLRAPDRVEVALTRRPAQFGENKSEEHGTVPGVDKVHRETRADAVITRLTKFVNESGATV